MLYYREKESNKKHYLRIFIISLLILVSALVPSATNISSNIVMTIISPVSQAASFISSESQNLIDNIFGSKANRERVLQLEEEVSKLKEDNRKLQIVVNNSQVLENNSLLKEKTDLTGAKVVAMDENDSFKNFIINVGSNQGIHEGDIVVTGFKSNNNQVIEALVGKVDEVFINTSRVVSIIDDKFNITFEHKKTGNLGVINSRFNGLLEGYLLDKDTEISVGDEILTSGLGLVYNQGIYIGKVEEVTDSEDQLTRNIRLRSPVDFNKIYDVFIIKNSGEVNE